MGENPDGGKFTSPAQSPPITEASLSPLFSYSSGGFLSLFVGAQTNGLSIKSSLIKHTSSSPLSISDLHTFYCVLTIPRGPFLLFFSFLTHNFRKKRRLNVETGDNRIAHETHAATPILSCPYVFPFPETRRSFVFISHLLIVLIKK